jgi:transposase
MAAAMLPDVDAQALRRFGIDEYRYRSVRWFRAHESSRGCGSSLDEHDRRPGHWPQARHRGRRLGVEAIDPSAVFRKALRTGLSRPAVSVATWSTLVFLVDQVVTEAQQRLSQELKGAAADRRSTRVR